MFKIKEIKVREILDSRGNPTIETTVILENGSFGTAAAPSGASLGKHEAVEIRDNDHSRFGGMGVLRAVANVAQIIGPRLIGIESTKQGEIDKMMIDLDGTKDKSKLGSNSILSVSLAVALASANGAKIPLYRYFNSLFGGGLPSSISEMPTPTFNIINGGKHGAGNLNFQEFHIVPSRSKSYRQALQLGEEIYQALKRVLAYRSILHSVGDEGGFTPNLFTNLDALEIILEAVKTTPYAFGRDLFFGLDVAASQFKKGNEYQIKDRPTPLSNIEFIEYLQNLNSQYRLLMLEDPLGEDDWDDWVNLTKIMGKETMIVGDDLLATNSQRLKEAVEKKACTAALVKLNQVGTLTETLEFIKAAKSQGFVTIISHRSGETIDTFIADLAVAVGAEYVKFGAPARGERIAKYNRLLEIEAELKL